jgi:hypothetical protein
LRSFPLLCALLSNAFEFSQTLPTEQNVQNSVVTAIIIEWTVQLPKEGETYFAFTALQLLLFWLL